MVAVRCKKSETQIECRPRVGDGLPASGTRQTSTTRIGTCNGEVVSFSFFFPCFTFFLPPPKPACCMSNAEADRFACFVRLLSDSVDHFCQQLDNSSVGILSTLARLAELLKVNDEVLWRHLEFCTKVKPQFYALGGLRCF